MHTPLAHDCASFVLLGGSRTVHGSIPSRKSCSQRVARACVCVVLLELIYYSSVLASFITSRCHGHNIRRVYVYRRAYASAKCLSVPTNAAAASTSAVVDLPDVRVVVVVACIVCTAPRTVTK